MDVKKKPKVSVVMAVYNAQEYLDESITSILSQSFENIEFIIINDGSTDKSSDLIKKYLNIDSRIIFINHNQNKGLPYSLNEGLKKASGEYIARMDADDISEYIRIEKQVEFMNSHQNVGVCGTWVEMFGENYAKRIVKYPLKHEELKTRLLFSVCFAHPTVMFRASLLKNNDLFYNEEFCNSQDYELWSRISMITRMANVPHVLLKYRVSANNITNVTNSSNEGLRYKLLNKIHQKYLYQLGIDSANNEKKLHFELSLNERIKSSNINLDFLNSYLYKILRANVDKQVFKDSVLRSMLAKKFFIVCFYNFTNRKNSLFEIVSYRFFWFGLLSMINSKIFGRVV